MIVISSFTQCLSEAYSKVSERPARPKPSRRGLVQHIDGGTSCQVRFIHRAEDLHYCHHHYGSNARQALDKAPGRYMKHYAF